MSLPAKQQGLQYDLFTQFFGKTENLSNTIELWDALPKYSFSAKMQAAKRDANGRLPVFQRSFEYRPAPKADNPTLICTLSIQPASIIENGRRIDFYPSNDEEIIDEILDFSKIESGRVEFERVVFNLPTTLDEALSPETMTPTLPKSRSSAVTRQLVWMVMRAWKLSLA